MTPRDTDVIPTSENEDFASSSLKIVDQVRLRIFSNVPILLIFYLKALELPVIADTYSSLASFASPVVESLTPFVEKYSPLVTDKINLAKSKAEENMSEQVSHLD